MGRTTLVCGQIRDVQSVSFFSGTNVYRLGQVYTDRVMTFDMRTKYPTPHILQLVGNTFAEGVRFAAIIRNIQATQQSYRLEVEGCDSYQPMYGGGQPMPWEVLLQPGECDLLELIKVGGAIYMVTLPGSALYRHTSA